MNNFNNRNQKPFNKNSNFQNNKNNNFNNRNNNNNKPNKVITVDESEQYINPYNFITLPDKCNRMDSKERRGTLNGYIECSLTAKTPVIVPDTSNVPETGFKEYKFFNYQEKNNNFTIPVIPGSEIRGMLRSDYEVFTDSCMSTLSDDINFISRTKEIKLPGILEKDSKGNWTLYKAQRYSLHTCRNEKDSGFPRPVNGNKEAIYMVDQRNRIEINGKKYQTGEKISFRAVAGSSNPKVLELGNGNLKGILFIGEIGGKKVKNQIHDSVFVSTGELLPVKNLNDEVVKLQAIFDLYNDKAFNQKIRGKNKVWYAGYDIENLDVLPVWYSALDAEKRTYLSLAAIGKEAYHRSLSELVGDFMPCVEKTNVCNCCNMFGFVSDEDADSSKIRISDAIYTNNENPYDKKMIIKELSSPHIANASFYALYAPNTDFDGYSRNFDFNYDFMIDQNGKHYIDNEHITIRGRKQYWHHGIENATTTEMTDRNCAVEPVKVGTEFKFKIYFNDINKENLDELISVINLEYDEKHELYHKIGKGKPLGFGSCKITANEVYIKDVRVENNKVKYDMKNYDLYFDNALKDVSLKSFKNMDTISMKEALRIYDFNYIKKYYPNSKVQYPVAEKNGKENSMNWFMLNKSVDLRNSYIIMVLPRIIDGVDEYNPGNQKEIELKVKNNKIGKTKGLSIPKYKI